MTFLRSNILTIILMFALFLPGCASVVGPELLPGDVIPVHVGTARMTIQQAMTSCCSTSDILTNGRLYVFLKQVANGWSMVIVDANSKTIIDDIAKVGGSFTTTETLRNLAGYLLKNNWTRVVRGTLPASTKVIITMIINSGKSITSFLVTPVGVFKQIEELDGSQLIEY